ncbi:DMT family transporter [Thiomicrorhabdus indica]|uniref:DMT family transporter n=1 Tax=Thiomicrorhabdus indica TaxID=2267253 RepID=UPI0013EEA1DA|nr:DMT family transporter [Thiomicrorhabdus indica]
MNPNRHPAQYYRLAYFLLALAALFWAGNFVLARAMHANIPPIGLAFWRWFAVAVFIVPWAWQDLKKQWPIMKAHAGFMLALGILSVGAFNTLVYIGLQTTSAVNALLLLSSVPVFILLMSPVILGHRLNAYQIMGMVVSGSGVLLVLTQGKLLALADFGHDAGLLWVLTGVISWALYSVLLHKLPKGIGGSGFFAVTVLVGVFGLLPFYAWESVVQQRPITFITDFWLTVAYVAFFASILAYMFWNKAVDMIGAERAGGFIHLMPAFGLMLSALLLDEAITVAALLGLGLIFAGLVLAAGKSIWRKSA